MSLWLGGNRGLTVEFAAHDGDLEWNEKVLKKRLALFARVRFCPIVKHDLKLRSVLWQH